ncbi:restriction endonuclease subunit S [Limnohabitans sp. TS-CS-82]|uniref:restriction endonuclease subunit S n=1 Tax=Limnohabitans sp. TS-CS-82 TaxID=2094193 RepID=UPI000CF2CC81|nr:restriction endonuclease subunit S [Limnohabitans sp. TS-CS-82]PQA85041.1 restriction endonuclease subunit S [Limnohabitans sp. TS-CS-82]
MSAVLTVQEPSAKYLVNLQPPLVRHFDLIAQAPGGVTRLRELILTLAVQGKLVPQEPSDEPASELLKKIRTEKDRLIAEGKIKRDKPWAEILESESTAHIPNSWTLARLGTVVNVSTGKLDANAAVQGGRYPFFTCSVTPLEIDSYSFDCKAVLLAGNGDFNLKRYEGKFDAYQRTYVIEPILWDLQYLYFLLSQNISIITKNNRGSAIPYLKLGDITEPVIAIPPLAEQSRIVTRVEELMQLCDALEVSGQLETQQHAQLVGTLLGTLTQSETPEELADNWQRIATHFDLLLDRPEAVDALEQTILQLAVRGLLVPQDPTDEPASVLLQKIRTEKDHLIAQGKIKRDKPLPPITDQEKPFELPYGWELARFGDLAQISSGVTLGRKTPLSKPLLFPYLRVANVQRWFLNLQLMKDVLIDEAELPRFQVCAGDLLITEGGDWDKVGRTAIWRDELSTCLHQNHVFKARGLTAEWCPEWAELYLNSDVARSYFAASAKQTTNLASINMTELKHCVFPLPPLKEQSRIVTRVNELRGLCADLRERLESVQIAQIQLTNTLMAS